MLRFLFRTRYTASAILLLALLVGACASASAVRLGEASYPPRPSGHPVLVYDALPSRPSERIGHVVGEGEDASFAAIVAAMQQQARELGADAIVLRRGAGFVAGGEECGDAGSGRAVEATAIRWRRD